MERNVELTQNITKLSNISNNMSEDIVLRLYTKMTYNIMFLIDPTNKVATTKNINTIGRALFENISSSINIRISQKIEIGVTMKGDTMK